MTVEQLWWLSLAAFAVWRVAAQEVARSAHLNWTP